MKTLKTALSFLLLILLFAYMGVSLVEAFDAEQERYEAEGKTYSEMMRQGTEGKQ